MPKRQRTATQPQTRTPTIMQTLCPQCHTRFRIRADQLAAKSGWVRCGVCMAAFQSLTQLAETTAALAPNETALEAEETEGASEDRPKPTLAFVEEEAAPALFVDPPLGAQLATQGSPGAAINIQFIDEGKPPQANAKKTLPTPSKPRASAKPSSPARSGSYAILKAMSPTWLWGGVALLIFTFIGQSVALIRHPPRAQAAPAIALAQVSMNPVPNWPDLLQISFSLKNQSDQTQALPSLAFIFSNGETQALSVEQYSAPSTLAAQQIRSETLWLKRANDNPLTATPSAWMPNKLGVVSP